jgi:hypothetical protein
MKFFSKITFICNLGFLVFIVLRFIDFTDKKPSTDNGILPLSFVTGNLVILGQFAIFLNIIFCVFIGVLFFLKKTPVVALWLLIVNFLFLLIELYHFLIY